MNNCYIVSASSISAQDTFQEDNFLDKVESLQPGKVSAKYPDYKQYISPAPLRRMATTVRMGVVSAKQALEKAQNPKLDAIITGTGMGCIEDTEKFLNAIITNDEMHLTPTSFIQSTHNTVSAQIALLLESKAYNNTYVHSAISFESALLDAKLMLNNNEAENILIGGVDELGNEFIDYVAMIEQKQYNSIQVPLSEGASFFVISSKKTIESVEVVDIKTRSSLPIESVLNTLEAFLDKNGLSVADLDVVVLGNNGDEYDNYYKKVTSNLENDILTLNYKHLSGEFFTASAFGLWMAFNILKRQHVPESIVKNNSTYKELKTVLLYNQFKGRDHSFILLKKC